MPLDGRRWCIGLIFMHFYEECDILEINVSATCVGIGNCFLKSLDRDENITFLWIQLAIFDIQIYTMSKATIYFFLANTKRFLARLVFRPFSPPIYSFNLLCLGWMPPCETLYTFTCFFLLIRPKISETRILLDINDQFFEVIPLSTPYHSANWTLSSPTRFWNHDRPSTQLCDQLLWKFFQNCSKCKLTYTWH